MVTRDDPKLDRLRDLCCKLSAGQPPTAELSWLVDDPDWPNIHIAMRLMAERLIVGAVGAHAPYSAVLTYCAGIFPALRAFVECDSVEFQYRVDSFLKLKPVTPPQFADEGAPEKRKGQAVAALGVFFYGIDPTDDQAWRDFVGLLQQVREFGGTNV